MKRFENILVATDTRQESHPIVDEAAEVAIQLGATLKLVDVVPPFSWITKMTMEDPEHVMAVMVQEKARKLESLAEPIQRKGVQVETRVLTGATSVEIVKEVLRGRHDLVMRIAKAKSSRRRGFFGATGIELLRKCPCAVWLVCPTTSAQFKHVMACVEIRSDREVHVEIDRKVLEISCDISQRHNASLSVVHAWSIDGEQFLRKRSSKAEFGEIQRARLAEAQSRLDHFIADRGVKLDDGQLNLVKGEPYDAIPAFAAEHGIDLVVMGLAGNSGPAGWILGSVTEQVLDSIQCSVLALKPDGFVSPIRLDEESVDQTRDSSS